MKDQKKNPRFFEGKQNQQLLKKIFATLWKVQNNIWLMLTMIMMNPGVKPSFSVANYSYYVSHHK